MNHLLNFVQLFNQAWNSEQIVDIKRKCWELGHSDRQLDTIEDIKKQEDMKSEETEMELEKLTGKVLKHKDLVLTVAGLLTIDHFLFDGKFKKMIKKIVNGAMSELGKEFFLDKDLNIYANKKGKIL